MSLESFLTLQHRRFGDIKTHAHVFKLGMLSYNPCLLVASVSPHSTRARKCGRSTGPNSKMLPQYCHPSGHILGSEPVCPEQGSTGYAVAPLHLCTGTSWHREEMKARACPDPIPATAVPSEPALRAAQDLLSLIVWQQPRNQMRSHQAQMQATLAKLLYKGITG